MSFKFNPLIKIGLDRVNDAEFTLFTGTIAPAASTDIKIDDDANFTGCRVSFELYFADLTKNKSFDMNITKRSSGLTDSVYARMGNLSASVVANISGPDIILSVTNNEATAVSYKMKRMLI